MAIVSISRELRDALLEGNSIVASIIQRDPTDLTRFKVLYDSISLSFPQERDWNRKTISVKVTFYNKSFPVARIDDLPQIWANDTLHISGINGYAEMVLTCV